MQVFNKILAVGMVVVIAAILSSCAAPIKQAQSYEDREEWMKAVLEYRKLRKQDPGNIEYRSRLEQLELKAADRFYQKGAELMAQGNIDAAVVEFQQGLVAKSDHQKLRQTMKGALAKRESDRYFAEAERNHSAGKFRAARKLYKKALAIYPAHKESKKGLAVLKQDMESEGADKLALSSQTPITLKFRRTDLRTAFEFIAKSSGVNVIFDQSVKSSPVTLFAEDVTFEQALKLLLTTTKTFYKRIGPNTILIAPDTKDKRGQYEDHIVRTFTLNTIMAKEMAKIIKGVLTVKKVIVNEELNTIVARDTEGVLNLIERLIQNNDRKPAEMILDVEILEINRTKAERLGIDFGYELTTSFTDFKVSSSWGQALANGTVSLPAVTFRYFKQDVDAKTLANPKIRVIHGKIAKIHIGDRIPLRASTIQDTTGQIRTTYTYSDIGIKLTVEPRLHLDNSVTVKLSLEVSSLGQNLGTPDEPAFSIGTRNAETYMLLRDGETAILGGLIRDEERGTRVRVPGIGDIPVVGSLFRTKDDSSQRTDVLLTITPRIVRAWDLPTGAAREFFSGTEKRYSDQSLFSYLQKESKQKKGGKKTGMRSPRISIGESSSGGSMVAEKKNAVDPSGAPVPFVATPVLSFSKPVYQAASEQEFEIKLQGKNLGSAKTIPVEILYNPQLLEFVKGSSSQTNGTTVSAKANQQRGVLRIVITPAENVESGASILATIVMRGKRQGISYLVYKTPTFKDADGKSISAQVRASRVVIK